MGTTINEYRLSKMPVKFRSRSSEGCTYIDNVGRTGTAQSSLIDRGLRLLLVSIESLINFPISLSTLSSNELRSDSLYQPTLPPGRRHIKIRSRREQMGVQLPVRPRISIVELLLIRSLWNHHIPKKVLKTYLILILILYISV